MAKERQAQGSFPLAAGRQRGYRIEQVDEFLDRARRSYEGNVEDGEALTAADVRAAAFGLRKRGYSARHVDAALDRLEDVFFERERRARLRLDGEDAWWNDTRELLSEVRGRLRRPRGKRFRTRGILATGYRKSQVDAFLDVVEAALRERRFAHTPSEVREVVFHSQWRGYDEAQVDALMDAVVELILATR